MKVKVKGKSLSHVRLLATPWTAVYQAPPSMGFSRQEYWSGCAFQKTPISRSALNKNPMPAHHFEGNPVDESTTRRGTDPLMHLTEKTEGSTHSSTNGLLSCEQLERQAATACPGGGSPGGLHGRRAVLGGWTLKEEEAVQ